MYPAAPVIGSAAAAAVAPAAVFAGAHSLAVIKKNI
jgi:hypothetical protein